MPNMDGLTFLLKLREAAPGREIPFVMVTSEAHRDRVIEAIRSGAHDYIVKPFDRQTLKEKLDQVARDAVVRRERRERETQRLKRIVKDRDRSSTSIMRRTTSSSGVHKQSDIDELARRETRQVSRDGPGSSGRVESGLSGMLDTMELAEVVQALHESKKTGMLRLHRKGELGRIYFHHGEVRQARVGDLSADEAFYDMVAWPDGTFAFEPGTTTSDVDIEQPTMNLLMEGLRRKDEKSRDA
jgi:CheY-like chemotaxis protein